MLLFSSSSSSPSPPPAFSSSSSICFASVFFMDSSDFPVSKSPRRELQGPRPAPLKVRKDSYKIRKPPVPPQPQQLHHPRQQQPPAQLRPPVIIYTVSPKVIHTNPSEFMTLVQRLTGSTSSSSATCSSQSSTSYDPFNDGSGAISPAARYASIEKTKTPDKTKQQSHQHHHHDHDQANIVGGIEMDHNIERSSLFPGILSPGPTSLPMISPSFFSPPSDPNSFSFFHDLSPVLHGNKNFMEGSFMPSPSSFLSPYITSPTPSIDLFNNLFNFD